MLNKVIIINSELYAKAEIQLGDASSIQLVGQNNVGKSSLINTLNFLYITEPNQMRFEGNRRLKESIPHYFPTLNQSYIIFEVKHSKDSAYTCILVKRTKDNEISYHTIPHAYQEDLFFTTKDNTKQVIPFDELTENLLFKKIICTPLNVDALYRTVYSEERAENPVLLLARQKKYKRTKGRRRINTFAEIYKHLIRSAKPTANDLTDMLIAASYTDARDLTIFAENSNTHLEELQELERKARKLEDIKPQFQILKKEHTTHEQLQKNLGKAYYTFLEQYPIQLRELNKNLIDVDKKIQAQQTHLNQINEQKATLLQAKGHTQSIITQQKNILATLAKKFETIDPYKSQLALSALQAEVDTLEAKKIALKKALYGNTTQPKSPQQLKKELTQLQNSANSLTQTIENFSDTLIQHISPNLKVQQRLNTLLSQQLLYLPKTAIKKQVTKTLEELALFDGSIDISTITTDKPFTSIEELRTKLEETQRNIQTIQDLINNQETLTHTETQWKQRFTLLTQVLDKPNLIKQQQEAQKALAEAQEKEKTYDQQLQTYQNTEKSTLQTIDKHKEEHRTLYATKERYETWKGQLRQSQLPTIEEKLPETSLEKLYAQIQLEKEQTRTQEEKTRKLLQNIAFHIGKSYQEDHASFIKNLQEDLDAMEDLTKKRDTVLDSVINTFVYPTQIFIDQYLEFKSYVQDFSKKLAGHHISGIQKIDLHLEEVTMYIDELTAISQIKADLPLSLKDSQEDERMKILRKHIAAEKPFQIKDLFKLKLKLTKKDGKTHTLDISKQMESYGTDKVLRIFIFLMLLKEFFVSKPYNRVAIYIDEIGTVDKENIQRILHLCAQYHVLPIFASISLVEGFGKYYLLLPSEENAGKLYVDEQTLMQKPTDE